MQPIPEEVKKKGMHSKYICWSLVFIDVNVYLVGWIHAVSTPADSLVFGGNFLHRYNMILQLWLVVGCTSSCHMSYTVIDYFVRANLLFCD